MVQNTRLGSTLVEGMKTPVVVATTLNITLQGLPLISGVQLAANDRVLVKTQNNKAENGIYVVAAGTWDRAKDFNANNDVVNGQVVVDSNSGLMYRVDFTGTFDLGVTLTNFFVVQSFNSKDRDNISDMLNDSSLALTNVVHVKEETLGAGSEVLIFDVRTLITEDTPNGIYTGIANTNLSFVRRKLGVIFDEAIDRLNPPTVAIMVGDTTLELGDFLTVQDYATGHNSGYLQFKVVAEATGTADGGSFIDLPNTTPALQAQQIFPINNEISVMAFGAKRGGVGVIDATTEFIACKDYCIANDFTMTAPDGDFWFVADLDLWGVRKIKFNCRILFTLTTTKLIVGGSTISVPSTNIELYVCSGTIQVYGMNRGDLKFNQANTLYLFASNLFSLQRFTVSYCRFEWVNVDNIHLECQDPDGPSGAWINENKFYGGRARVSFLMDGTYPMNNNIFYGMALESMDIDIQIGQNTHFHDVRLEKAPDPVVMSLNFGAGTFNNIFWLTWGNFANTSIWDQPAAAWAITDAGDNNRIVSAHYAYTEKDVILNIDRENLGDGTAFIVSPVNADKVQIINNAITICDTGKIQVTDKLWFRHTGQVASFFIRMEVYDEDGVAITVEPGAGFKDSQGTTVFNVAGFYEYTNPVLGGAYAVNPIKDTAVKYVRFLVITDNGAAGDEHTNVRSMLVQPQEDKRPVKNLLEDKVRVDVISNRVSAVSEATAIDLFKFSSGAFVTADASGSLAGTLEIALTGEKGSVEDATKATVDIMITKENTGLMTITTGTPVFLSNGGALLIDGITLATKAGATTTEAILTITITSSTHADPFDALRARARLTGVADFNNFGSYLIAAEAI